MFEREFGACSSFRREDHGSLGSSSLIKGLEHLIGRAGH